MCHSPLGSSHLTRPALPRREEMQARLGELVAGRFRLTRVLGAGGMGWVYLAIQEPLERPVALKVLVHDRNVDAFRQRFFREASVAARLSSPHIVTIHDYGQTEQGELFIAMEYVEGTPLSALLKREGPFEPARICRFVRQICKGLSVAHDAGVVHRDLKPSNIMLVTDREGDESVKVLDFGLVKSLSDGEDDSDLTGAGMVLGSPNYMAPEQIRRQTVDQRTDIYSMGALIYRLLTGRAPYQSNTIVETMSLHLNGVPPSIEQFLPSVDYVQRHLEAVALRCLEKNPAARYGSMDELKDAIKGIERTIPADPLSPQRRMSSTGSHPLSSEAFLSGSFPAQSTGPQYVQSTELNPGQSARPHRAQSTGPHGHSTGPQPISSPSNSGPPPLPSASAGAADGADDLPTIAHPEDGASVLMHSVFETTGPEAATRRASGAFDALPEVVPVDLSSPSHASLPYGQDPQGTLGSGPHYEGPPGAFVTSSRPALSPPGTESLRGSGVQHDQSLRQHALNMPGDTQGIPLGGHPQPPGTYQHDQSMPLDEADMRKHADRGQSNTPSMPEHATGMPRHYAEGASQPSGQHYAPGAPPPSGQHYAPGAPPPSGQHYAHSAQHQASSGQHPIAGQQPPGSYAVQSQASARTYAPSSSSSGPHFGSGAHGTASGPHFEAAPVNGVGRPNAISPFDAAPRTTHFQQQRQFGMAVIVAVVGGALLVLATVSALLTSDEPGHPAPPSTTAIVPAADGPTTQRAADGLTTQRAADGPTTQRAADPRPGGRRREDPPGDRRREDPAGGRRRTETGRRPDVPAGGRQRAAATAKRCLQYCQQALGRRSPTRHPELGHHAADGHRAPLRGPPKAVLYARRLPGRPTNRFERRRRRHPCQLEKEAAQEKSRTRPAVCTR